MTKNIYKMNLVLYEEYKNYLNQKINTSENRQKQIYEELLNSLEKKFLLQKKTKIHPTKFYVNLKLEFNNLKMIGANNG